MASGSEATPQQVAALVSAPELPEVSVLRLRPGDTLVFRFKSRLPYEQHEEFMNQLAGRFPDNPVAVVEGADLVVLRKDGA